MSRTPSHGVDSVTVAERLRCLSRRQRDIAQRYANGLTYKQIAAELFIAPSTVRNHLATVYHELGIGNKADLARLMATAPEAGPADAIGAAAKEAAEQPVDPSPDTDDYALKPWLQALALEQYAGAFAANAIDRQVLPTLDDQDLQALGVTCIGHRKRLLQAIAALSVNADAAGIEETDVIPASAQPERRQLTVMFCDLVDSTALAERFDPEELSTLMRTYQETCARVIAGFEGYIARYMGDGLLVYFGWPQAHEDDVERALRAGLAVIEAIGRLKLQLELTLQVRIGVATGSVVVGETIGEGAAQEQAVVGQAPNLAARLQRLGAPNSLLIGARTRHLAGAVFDYADLGEHTLKGFSAPVQVWQVLGAHAAASRFDERHSSRLTPLAGRHAELQLLQERWAQLASGEGQVVLLTGEAGIGKSRIVHELLAALDVENDRLKRYQCSPYHRNTALYPFIAHLNQQLARHAQRNGQDRLEPLLTLAAPSGQSPKQTVPLLAALLSLPVDARYPPLELGAARQKEATLALLSRLTLAGAEAQPLLLVVEDIHWLDPSSGELLVQLIAALQTTPALLILTTRPGFSAPCTDFAHVTALTLNRLNREQALLMVDAIAVKPLLSSLRTHIADKTDGVPLFVEEMTTAVLESDAVVEQAGRYVLASPRLPAAVIPATLQDALIARLDRLGPVKQIAQIGAVIGREFSYPLLASVSDLSDTQLISGLDRLVASGLSFRRGTPPDACYIFKHALVQDVTYDCLLRAKRQQLHADIAQVLEQRFPETVENEPELLAQHYTGAGLYQQAVVYWQKAGERAVQRSANLEAVEHLNKGLELISHLPDELERARRELALQAQLGPALIAVKGYGAPETARCFDRARELTEQVGDSPQLFPVLYGCWVYKLTWAEYPTVCQMAEQFLKLAKKHADTGAMLTGHRILGFSLSCLGNFAEARENFDQVLALYQPQQHASLAFRYGQDPKAAGASMLAWNLWHLGYPDRAVQICDEAVAYACELNHTNTRGYVETFGAVRIHLFRRDREGVKRYVTSMTALCEEQKLVFWAGFIKTFEGWMLAEQGRYQAAIDTIRKALAAFDKTNTLMFRPHSYALLAQAYAGCHRTDDSLRVLDDALAIADNTAEHWITAELHRLKGEILLQTGGGANITAAAESCFQQSLTVARERSAKSWELRTATSLARLWRAQDKHREALELLAPVYNWFTEGFATADLKDAKELLEELS